MFIFFIFYLNIYSCNRNETPLDIAVKLNNMNMIKLLGDAQWNKKKMEDADAVTCKRTEILRADVSRCRKPTEVTKSIPINIITSVPLNASWIKLQSLGEIIENDKEDSLRIRTGSQPNTRSKLKAQVLPSPLTRRSSSSVLPTDKKNEPRKDEKTSWLGSSKPVKNVGLDILGRSKERENDSKH